MLEELAPRCSLMIINEAPNERAASAVNLADEAARYTQTIAVKDIEESIRKATDSAKENDAIIICGSMYMLGMAMKILKKKK